MTRSADGFALQLWFTEAPLDGLSSIARRLESSERRALNQVEVYRVPGQTVVQVHLRSRAKGLFVKKAHNPRGWKLVGHLHEPPEIRGVSYADRKLVPSFVIRSLLGSIVKDMRDGKRPKCEWLDEMSSASSGWPAWVALAQADCFRFIGNKERSETLTNRLVRQRGVPKAVTVLSGLRLEEWPATYNPWIRMGMSNKDLKTLPRNVVQEVNIRQARRMLRNGKTKRAVGSFRLALKHAILPEELEWSSHDVRLELMEGSLQAEKPQWAVELYQAMPAPPADHPVYLPTLRTAAIAYARLGFMDQAAGLAEIVLYPKGSVVDPELTSAVVRSLRGSKKFSTARKLSRAMPTELNWISMLGNDDTLSPSTSLLLAEWLLDTWRDAGVHEASQLAKSGEFYDPHGAYSEAKMAVLLGGKECEELLKDTPGVLPNDRAGFASLCYLKLGEPLASLDPFNPDKSGPLDDNGILGHVIQSYAEESTDFYAALAPLKAELESRSPREREALLREGSLELAEDSEDSFLGAAIPTAVPPGLVTLDTPEDYEKFSAEILEKARELQASGKLKEDEAMREAIRKHAEASAKLLESLATN